jgi:ABC-2 type transport system permease protein
MIFLSGSIFPVGRLPWFLQDIAAISPLTYLNNGLRSAMTSGEMANAWANLAIVCTVAIALFAIGVITLKWRDD